MVKHFVIAAAIAISTLFMPVAQAREPDPITTVGKNSTPSALTPEIKIWFDKAIDQILSGGDIVGLRPAPEAAKPVPRR